MKLLPRIAAMVTPAVARACAEQAGNRSLPGGGALVFPDVFMTGRC